MDNQQRHDDTRMDAVLAYGTATLGGLFVMALVLFFTDIAISGAVAIGLVLGAIAAWILHKSMVNPLPAPNQAPAPRAATPSAPPPAPEPAPTSAGPATPGQTVSTGTILPGEQDLASRKGEWKYEGAQAGAVPGTRPQLLDGPRDGAKDDLQQIRGIGPKLEEMLNGMGIYHYDQIASWSADELAWVDAHLEGFKGRASRDDWVAQARALTGH